MKMLRSLLAIQRLRERQAEAALRARHQALVRARRQRAAAQALLARQLTEGVRAERQLYAGLHARLVRVAEIEQAHLCVAALRRRERLQQDALDAAQRALETAQQRFDQARSQHQQAARRTLRLLDLASRLASLEALASERREDLAQEEAAGVLMVRTREDASAMDGEPC